MEQKDVEKQAIAELRKDLIEIFDEEYEKRRLITADFTARKMSAKGYRKQSEGELVEVGNWSGSIEYQCTACKEAMFHAEHYNYCPFCGAKMKGGAE